MSAHAGALPFSQTLSGDAAPLRLPAAPNIAVDAAIEEAYAFLLREKRPLVIVDRQDGTGSYVVLAERGIIPVDSAEAPELAATILDQRRSNRFFTTQLTRVPALEGAGRFMAEVRELSQLALFNPYLEGDRREFGFVAKRVAEGTLITGRGSSKSHILPEDVSLITGIDEQRRTLQVSSLGNKASLNASLAQLILDARPEVNYLLHAHIPLAEAVSTGRHTAPASIEDWESVRPLVTDGATAISQPDHGVLILLRDLSELTGILERNGIYRSNAGAYDDAYCRFLSGSKLIDLFCERVDAESPVLDLACGSGEVSGALHRLGYRDITACDRSPAMLGVARAKLGAALREIIEAPMERLPFEEAFDGIICRQAINYVEPSALTATFAGIRRALRPGGWLLFNTFSPDRLPPAARLSRDVLEDRVVVTREGNLVHGALQHHGQRTEVFDTRTHGYRLAYDLNSFWRVAPETYEAALHAAKFFTVWIREGHSLYFMCRS